MNPRMVPATQPNREQAVKDLVAIGLTEAQARNIVASVQPSAKKGAATLVDWPYVLCTTDGCTSDHGGGIFKDEKGVDYLKLAQAECPDGDCVGEVVIMQVPADENGNITSHGPLVVRAASLAEPATKTVDVTAKPVEPPSPGATRAARLAELEAAKKKRDDDAAAAAENARIAELERELGGGETGGSA